MSDWLQRVVSAERSLLRPRAPLQPDLVLPHGAPGSPRGIYKPPARYDARSSPNAAVTAIHEVTDPRDGLRISGTSNLCIDVDGATVPAGRVASQGATLRVTGLVRRYDGTLVSIGPEGKGYLFTIRGDRTIGDQIVDVLIPQGEVVALNVDAPQSLQPLGYTPVRGQVWVSVQRTRLLPDNSRVFLQTLIGNYLSTNNPISYPSSAVINPRDGVGLYRRLEYPGPFPFPIFCPITIPVGVEWQVVGLQANLGTSAVAGNRYVQLGIGSGSVASLWTSGIPQGPSITSRYWFTPGATTASDVGVPGGPNNNQAFPSDFRVLRPATGFAYAANMNSLAVQIGNQQAGDSLSFVGIDVIEHLTADG